MEKLIEMINGRQYRDEITEDIRQYAKDNNIVIVFGASDDLMEFDGAIYDEVGCYDGGIAYLNKNGLFENKCEKEHCPYAEEEIKKCKTIEAIWCEKEDCSWTYKTDIPHNKFNIYEDEELYCIGIAFYIKDME